VSASYIEKLDYLLGIDLAIEFVTERGVLVYDSAHGFNEMHRFTRGSGKQTGIRFHSGTLAEGMNSAIAEAKRSCQLMIEGWRNG